MRATVEQVEDRVPLDFLRVSGIYGGHILHIIKERGRFDHESVVVTGCNRVIANPWNWVNSPRGLDTMLGAGWSICPTCIKRYNFTDVLSNVEQSVKASHERDVRDRVKREERAERLRVLRVKLLNEALAQLGIEPLGIQANAQLASAELLLNDRLFKLVLDDPTLIIAEPAPEESRQ